MASSEVVRSTRSVVLRNEVQPVEEATSLRDDAEVATTMEIFFPLFIYLVSLRGFAFADARSRF